MSHRIKRSLIAIFGVLLLCVAILLLSPDARQLAPLHLFYELVGRRFAPTTPELEGFVLQSGQDYCDVGRDSDCGGYRITGVGSMAVDQAAQQRGTIAAWCVDYVVLRRNQGRLTSSLIYWARIPRAMVVTRSGDGSYASSATQDCRTATLE